MNDREFRPAFDTPRNVAEAMAVLQKWSEGTCYTFSHRRAKVVYEILHYSQDKLRQDVEHELNGIDATEKDSLSGWWELPTQAEWGSNKLDRIKALFAKWVVK